MRLRTFATVFVALSTATASSGQDPEARAVMNRLQEKFDEIEAFSARFKQTLDADYAGSSTTVRGTIILSGDKYRIETEGQTVLTDGTTTWVYVTEDNQVIINDYVEDEGTFTPAHFLDERTERYDASFAEEVSAESYVVRLSTKSPDTYIESATLWIDKQDYTVSRIDVVDVNRASIRFEMSDVNLSPRIDEDTFTFQPAEGVEVVDLR